MREKTGGKAPAPFTVAVRLRAPVPLLTRGATIRAKRPSQSSPARQQGDQYFTASHGRGSETPTASVSDRCQPLDPAELRHGFFNGPELFDEREHAVLGIIQVLGL